MGRLGRFAIALGALSACYSPSPPSGVPCDLATPNCPSGQECRESGGAFYCLRPGETIGGAVDDGGVDTLDATTDAPMDMKDVPLDMPPNADLDGDNVLNDNDNCPNVSNADQYNEDGDRFGDACDPCPPYVDDIQLDDADGDNVSGRCDPYPTLAGDHIFFFEGFAGGVPTTMTMVGVWTAANGKVTGASAPNVPSTLSVPAPTTAETTMTLVQRKTTDFGGGGASFGMGTASLREVNNTQGVSCQNVLGLVQASRISVANVTTSSSLDFSTYDTNVNSAYHIGMARSGSVWTCGIANENGSNAVIIDGDLSVVPERVALRVRSGTAEFAWFLVLDRP